MPAFCGEDVMMRQFWEISTANVRESENREWIRLRQETFAGAAAANVVRRHRRVDELSEPSG